MRYTNIPKDKRNDVITMHIVERSEKITHFYEVVGLNKKESIEAVENDGYYDGSPNSDNNWVHLEYKDGCSEYGMVAKPKISETKHYIPCSNHGEVLEKEQESRSGRNFMTRHHCHNIMLIPKHVLDESGQKYVPTNQIAWIRSNPLCRSCRRKIKQGYALQEVAE